MTHQQTISGTNRDTRYRPNGNLVLWNVTINSNCALLHTIPSFCLTYLRRWQGTNFSLFIHADSCLAGTSEHIIDRVYGRIARAYISSRVIVYVAVSRQLYHCGDSVFPLLRCRENFILHISICAYLCVSVYVNQEINNA